MFKKQLIALSSALLTVGVISCGGGGGSSESAESSSASPSTSKAIEGGVYSSIVSNATVCLEDQNGQILLSADGNKACVKTDANGTFSLQVSRDLNLNKTQIALYVYDSNGNSIKIGEAAYSTAIVNGNTNLVAITPLTLADNNATLADDIGAIIHALGGDTSGNATIVDMSNIEIESVNIIDNGSYYSSENLNSSIESYLKQGYQLELKVKHKNLGFLILDVNPENATVPVTCEVDKNNDGKPETIKHLYYNVQEKELEWEEHIKELEYESEVHPQNSLESSIYNETEMETEHNNEEPKDYSYIISGEIIAKEIPDDLKIRITPDVEQVDGDWGGIVCAIHKDGTFGDECVLHGNIDNYNDAHNFQIIVFQDLNDDWRFDKSEENTVIWVNDNASYNGWKKIVIE